jgi:hypothetical protein
MIDAGIWVIKFAQGTTEYELQVSGNNNRSFVQCSELSEDRKFRFQSSFWARRSSSMRQQALVMMKKIENKEAFDVMMS